MSLHQVYLTTSGTTKIMTNRIKIALVVVACVMVPVVSRILVSRDAVFRDYYKVIDSQEKIAEDVQITDEDRAKFTACSEGRDAKTEKDCVRDFYDAYTMANGVEKAFLHLARTQRELPDSLHDCHYFSHGIGNAAYRLSGNNFYKAFEILNSGSVYKNIATCGNGYYHGVVEEFTAGEKDLDKLASMLGRVCQSNSLEGFAMRGNCFHGAGHAVLIQLDFNLPKALAVCDKMKSRPAHSFDCYTGAFMEYAQTGSKQPRARDGNIKLGICDSSDKKYQPACYMEFSSYFELASKFPGDYANNIGQCKRVIDPLNRMSCVKLFAIRSVRIVHYEKIREMCANTSSDNERVMCMGVVAQKIAGSINKSGSSDEYKKAVRDICGTLGGSLADSCIDLVTTKGVQLFYTSPLDLTFLSKK